MVRIWYALAVLNALKNWLWTHSLLYPFVLFALAAFVSIYSQDIKAFLHHWPRTKERWRKVKEKELIDRLALLKRLHNDSYQLLVYLTDQLIGLVFTCVITSLVLMIFNGIVHDTKNTVGEIKGVWVGIALGMGQNIKGVLKELSNYNSTVARLQQRLAKLPRLE